MTDEKVVCLCLHGCCQTAEAFSSYLNSLRKMSKKNPYQQIEFHFLAAPFDHPDGGLTWTHPPLTIEDIWHDKNCAETRNNPLVAVPKLTTNLAILKKSFDILDAKIQEIKPKVLLGFSQGAFVIYEYMRNMWRDGSENQSVERIVAMSGYTFDNVQTDENHNFTILNIVNPMDNVVPPSIRFEKAKTVYLLQHNNKNLDTPSREGHRIATRNGHMRTICNFILTGKFVE